MREKDAPAGDMWIGDKREPKEVKTGGEVGINKVESGWTCTRDRAE